jgi:organic radical activating enzyme
MLIVPHELQLHVTHSCNLTCEGCTHYSNHGHSGMLSLEEAEAWFDTWSTRIAPYRFTLLGGEPALHKDLTKFVYLAREKWKYSSIELISNGFYLHKHPELPEALKETNTTLGISVHHRESEEYINKFKPVYNLAKMWLNMGVRVEMRHSTLDWLRQYQGYGDKMMPFEDNDPKSSWKNCVSRACVQLHENKLWKCPGLAYLPMQAKKYNLSEKWEPYLKYEALESNCSDEEMKEFFSRQWESYCNMCPAGKQHFRPENPLLPVSYWKKLYSENVNP